MTAPSTCGYLRAVIVELDDELAVFADHAVTRSVETVDVTLQPVPECDPRDRETVTRVA